MSGKVYRNKQYGTGAHGATMPHIPENLIRKSNRKKDAGNCPSCAGSAKNIQYKEGEYYPVRRMHSKKNIEPGNTK